MTFWGNLGEIVVWKKDHIFKRGISLCVCQCKVIELGLPTMVALTAIVRSWVPISTIGLPHF